MKINENYILKNIAGSPVVMPVGDEVNRLHGMITLNAVSEMIWKAIDEGKSREEILSLLQSKYDVPAEKLASDLDVFLGKLRAHGILED